MTKTLPSPIHPMRAARPIISPAGATISSVTMVSYEGQIGDFVNLTHNACLQRTRAPAATAHFYTIGPFSGKWHEPCVHSVLSEARKVPESVSMCLS